MGDPAPRAGRRRLATVAATLGAVLLVVALAATGVRLAVLDEDRFARAAGEAVTAPPVARALGDLFTDRLVAAEPDVVTVEPLVRSGAAAVVGSSAAASLVRTAAREAHRSAVGGRTDGAALRLADVGLLVVQAVRRLSPDIARRIPADVDAALAGLGDGPAADALTTAAAKARTVGRLAWLASVLAAASLLASVVLASDRWDAARRAGFLVAAAGAITVLGHAIVRTAVVDAVTAPAARPAGRAAYDAFLGPVPALATAAVASGLLAVVAVAALGRRASLATTARAALGRLVAVRTGRRAVAAGCAVAGVVLLVDRDLAARIVATGGGVVLLIGGLEALLRSFVGLPTRRATGSPAARTATPGGAPSGGAFAGGAVGDGSPAARGRRVRRAGPRVAAVGAAVLVGAGAIGAATDRAVDGPAGPEDRCNGSRALCALRLDQVVVPATHNAYSSSRDGFLLANQATGMGDQLEGGIRGFLIDTHDGQRKDGRVFTRLDEDGSSRAKIEDAIGPDATRTALRLRRRMGGGGSAPVRPYLCHGFCELGAVPLEETLRGLRDFLLTHPGEVVVLSVEDEVAPERFARTVAASGLLDLVWRGAVAPLPTLGAMVRSGGRVLVLVENDAGDVPWLHEQFAVAQETPYDLQTAKELLGDEGCAVGRGGTRPPLFLLNHFLGTVPPRPRAAERVNARAALVAHVDRCRRLRGRTANLLAVDFWGTGDVVGAARELNRRRADG